MTLARVLDALQLPPRTRVDQRVPKKLLLEHAATTTSDKRQILDGVDHLRWIAALKPSNVGIPEFRDESHAYLEIAVLTLELRPQARSARLIQLVHRAIPYPVLLTSAQRQEVSLSLAHKRFSQNQADSVVLDGEVVSTSLNAAVDRDWSTFPLSAQPRTHLRALYHGWVEWVEAVQASRITGRFTRSTSPETRRQALHDLQRLKREIDSLRAQAHRESQINHRVQINLTLRRLEAELAHAAANLHDPPTGKPPNPS